MQVAEFLEQSNHLDAVNRVTAFNDEFAALVAIGGQPNGGRGQANPGTGPLSCAL